MSSGMTARVWEHTTTTSAAATPEALAALAKDCQSRWVKLQFIQPATAMLP